MGVIRYDDSPESPEPPRPAANSIPAAPDGRFPFLEPPLNMFFCADHQAIRSRSYVRVRLFRGRKTSEGGKGEQRERPTRLASFTRWLARTSSGPRIWTRLTILTAPPPPLPATSSRPPARASYSSSSLRSALRKSGAVGMSRRAEMDIPRRA